jgi:hypothetical protein
MAQRNRGDREVDTGVHVAELRVEELRFGNDEVRARRSARAK